MKKYLLGILLISTLGLVTTGPISCTSSPARLAYKADVASVTTANSALIAWKKYLEVQESAVIQRKHTGQDVSAETKALDDQWQKGSDLWDKYVAAQAVAFSATKSLIVTTNAPNGINMALTAVVAAEQDFVNFVKTLMR